MEKSFYIALGEIIEEERVVDFMQTYSQYHMLKNLLVK